MGSVCGPMNRDALFTATPTRGEADAYIRGVKAACTALGVPAPEMWVVQYIETGRGQHYYFEVVTECPEAAVVRLP